MVTKENIEQLRGQMEKVLNTLREEGHGDAYTDVLVRTLLELDSMREYDELRMADMRSVIAHRENVVSAVRDDTAERRRHNLVIEALAERFVSAIEKG